MPINPAIVPALVSGGVQLAQSIGNWVSQKNAIRESRREYDKMLKYNSPAEQMKRYKEAGLSPYLIYGQGSSGNVSSPRPADAVVPDLKAGGLGEYLSAMNFSEDIKGKRLQNAILANEVNRSHWRNLNEGLRSTRNSLELLTDFPDYAQRQADGKYYSSDVTNSFRRRINELKLAASDAAIERVRQAIAGMKSENVVKGVKAHYASEYGMVGGDWTQGLGLIKSLPSFFKTRAKSSIAPKLNLPTYRTPQTYWK